MVELWDALRPTKSWPIIGDSTIIYLLFANYTPIFLALLISYFVGSLLAGRLMGKIVFKRFILKENNV